MEVPRSAKICPVCGLEFGVERQAGELVITYSFRDWKPRCPNPQDPVLCSNLQPTILAMLADDEMRDRRCA